MIQTLLIVAQLYKWPQVSIPLDPKPTSQEYKVETPAHVKNLLIYFHGSGENVESIAKDPLKRPVFNRLKKDGYVIAYSNAHGDAWGNPQSVNDYTALTAYLQHKYHVANTVFLSQSMGGLPGLNTAENVNVKCWAGIYPVTNLDANYSPQYIKQIHDAYPAGDLANNDPAMHKFSIPLKIYASKSDSVVHASDNTAEFVRNNPSASWVRTQGDHGDASNFQPESLSNFYKSCLKQGN